MPAIGNANDGQLSCAIWPSLEELVQSGPETATRPVSLQKALVWLCLAFHPSSLLPPHVGVPTPPIVH